MLTLFQTDLLELFTNVMQTLVNVFYLLNSVHTIQDDQNNGFSTVNNLAFAMYVN